MLDEPPYRMIAMPFALCPLCRAAMRPWLTVPCDWRRTLGGPYALSWCDACSFGRLLPTPDPETVASFYQAEGYYTHRSCQESLPRQAAFLDRLRVQIAWRADCGDEVGATWVTRRFGQATLKVCDIGCGAGRLLNELQECGHLTVGVEPDPEARAAAAGRGLAVVDGVAEALPGEVGVGRFDLVFMLHALEHCRDPLAALRNAARILAPGGAIIVEVPNNATSGLRCAGMTWHWLDVPRHLSFFTPRSLPLACEVAGLRVRAVEFRGYVRQFQSPWIAAEQAIWDRFRQADSTLPLPPRASRRRAWRLLVGTLLASPKRKYDSVRVVASRED